jgi:hypothetical protein
MTFRNYDEMSYVCRMHIFVGKAEGKRLLGRPRRRCEDNIRTDITEIWWEGIDWMHLAQNRDQWLVLMNTATKLRFYERRGIS